MVSSTALGDALGRAGVLPPSDMARLRACAVVALKKSPNNWDGAKEALYEMVKGDVGLLWEMLAPYRGMAAQALLTEASPRNIAPPRPVDAKTSRPNGEAIAKIAAKSLLDTFRINGVSIGDLTPKQANRWAAKSETEARWVRLLTANLPPGERIRKYRQPEDAARLFEQANREQGDDE